MIFSTSSSACIFLILFHRRFLIHFSADLFADHLWRKSPLIIAAKFPPRCDFDANFNHRDDFSPF